MTITFEMAIKKCVKCFRRFHFTKVLTKPSLTFELAVKKCVKFFRLFHFMKVLTKPSLKGSASLSNILHSTISFSSSYNINQIR